MELAASFIGFHPQLVVHLAAQAGVRYSITHVNSNLTGFVNVLQACADIGVQHLVYASSSSVYGANTKVPFQVGDNVDHPISFYAATKRANELFAHSYLHLYGLPATGLRFFTVYGPGGRPDMAYFKFARAIERDKPIELSNYGGMQRDFTRVLRNPPTQQINQQSPGNTFSQALCCVYNIGNSNTVELLYFVQLIEKAFGKRARKRFLPRPSTPVEEGIPIFVA